MQDILEYLEENAVETAFGLELPTEDRLVDVEEELLMPLPREYRHYLQHHSDHIYGSLEPCTAADPHSHTDIVDVTSNCWEQGMPRTHICVCDDQDGAWAIDQDGSIAWWLRGTDEIDDSKTHESWWHWVRDVWLEGAL